MITVESLGLVQVWIDRDQLASTAKLLIEGYKIPALGVVDHDRKLIGWVTRLSLVGIKSTTRVHEILTEAPQPISVYEPVRDAASELVDRDADFLPVTRDGQFHSILTARSMLSTLRESFDPMTELPWSDHLWNWGVRQLEEGVEIAILFIDLDDFGKFNKTYGHVLGDRVIKKVAHYLEAKLNPRTDVLVRYGGDEFAVGTNRTREEAEELMELLMGDGEGLEVEGVMEKVTFSIGIYGGRRSKQRTHVHGASNVDNLINLASTDCMARKRTGRALIDAEAVISEAAVNEAEVPNIIVPEAPAPVVPAPEAVSQPEISQAEISQPEIEATEAQAEESPVAVAEKAPEAPVALVSGLQIETIQADDEPNSVTYVVLKSDAGLAVGTAAKLGNARSDAVATATAKAIEKAFGGSRVEVKSLDVVRAGTTELVSMSVKAVRDGMEREVNTQAEANGDLDETICLSVISAYFAE